MTDATDLHIRSGISSAQRAAACRDFARDLLGASELVAIIRPDNTASRRTAEKIGMEYVEDDTTGHIATRTVMGMSLREAPSI